MRWKKLYRKSLIKMRDPNGYYLLYNPEEIYLIKYVFPQDVFFFADSMGSQTTYIIDEHILEYYTHYCVVDRPKDVNEEKDVK
ncbi:MAG: hypothetical protein ABR980_12780 [Ignavibacteriaceae bacterium]